MTGPGGASGEGSAGGEALRADVFDASWLDPISARLATPDIRRGARIQMSALAILYYAGINAFGPLSKVS